MENDKNTPSGSVIDERKEVLMFVRDPRNENWISRLANGKIAILHRSCEETPIPGIEYLCTVQEKESHALSWILGLHQYPRFVIKADESCIFINKPGEKAHSIEHIYDGLREIETEHAFVIYRKENRVDATPRELKTDKENRIVDIELKLKDDTNTVFKMTFSSTFKRILNLKEVGDIIKKKMGV